MATPLRRRRPPALPDPEPPPIVERGTMIVPTECPKCHSPLQRRFGRNGIFLACPMYPGCRFTFSLPQEKPETPEPEDEKIPLDTLIDREYRRLIRRVISDDGTGKLPPVNQVASVLNGAARWHMFRVGKISDEEFGREIGRDDFNG